MRSKLWSSVPREPDMVAGIPVITTSRLILRPLQLSDADAVQKLFPRWEIVRFLASDVPWPYPADGALTFIRDIALPAIQQGTEWHWSIRLKTAPERLIGMISLMDRPGNNRGFWLDPALQGKGLMSEASTAVTDYWFEILERPVLRVPKAVENVQSRRISERSGMRLIETEDQDFVSGRRLPTEIWEITREEWRSRSR
jgi:ribosomal-protein-alanine N-acetyltransferase